MPSTLDAKSERSARVFDVVGVLLLTPLALLIGAVVAVLVMVDSPGPIFYRQRRVGKAGREFAMLKFRKMHRSAAGEKLTLHDDERLTPIGRLLTVTKFDELPQLWNVLRGDMRLVGPRPEVPEFVARYRDRYAPILAVRPGITGPAAVEFASEGHLLAQHPDPLRHYHETIMPRKMAIDIEYVRTRSTLGDVRILATTLLLPAVRIAARAHRTGGKRGHALAVGSVVALGLAFVLASGV